ncbi:hypothetical protein [Hugenholtzia roseola]|uniref:hypothetical protein n=1 Tax=Hugenholtzia roseola TaxID=1002 RepID=UPI00041D92D7|nr:hypothetical protein [Hugenholtzia roseola]
MKKILLAYLFFLMAYSFLPTLSAQITNYLGDESDLYAHTKQMNQFFRRFNNEEDKYGEKYEPNHPKFREPTQRKVYLQMLFDLESRTIDNDTKQDFINQMLTKPAFLDFHGGKWFAQVHTIFKYRGKSQDMVLFMRLQEEKVGSKWVIEQLHFAPFKKIFEESKDQSEEFLHPLSHEIEFMNLKRALEQGKGITGYSKRNFQPDYLTLFWSEVKQGNLEFETVMNIKFHFFQLDNWYFEISNFNRKGNNSGWLISNLIRMAKPEDKAAFEAYILERGGL